MLLPKGFTCRGGRYAVLFSYDEAKYFMHLHYKLIPSPYKGPEDDEFIDFYYQCLHSIHPHPIRHNYHHNEMKAMFKQISYIRTCPHWKQRSLQCRQSSCLPTELIMMIRDYIDHGVTLALFDQAWGIRPCTSMFCHGFVSDVWFEQCVDVMSTAEQESYLSSKTTALSTRTTPSYYCIVPTDYGLKMWVLKLAQHRGGDVYHDHLSRLKDPLTGIDDFVAVCCYVAPSPDYMAGKYRSYSQYLTSATTTHFFKIKRWFQQKSALKQSYYGYDPLMDACWLYPWSESNLISRGPNLSWSQCIYDTYIDYKQTV